MDGMMEVNKLKMTFLVLFMAHRIHPLVREGFVLVHND
jgi:hypothetical protein